MPIIHCALCTTMIREKQAMLPEANDMTDEEWEQHLTKVTVAHAKLMADEPLFQQIIDGCMWLVCMPHFLNPEAQI